ncbi:MAG: response regulator transcription factor [Pseudomonadota bacterium]
MKRVLVVDDDPHILEVIQFALTQAGFSVVVANDGKQALATFAATDPDLVLLDVLMPELDGLSVCREIRSQSAIPILILSSRDEEVDRIMGLDIGADDYLGKPFSPRELVARVHAHLRREDRRLNKPTLVANHGFKIDSETMSATFRDRTLTLTQTEFHLLRTLVARPAKVFSRDDLMQQAYQVHRVVSHRTIDSHIRRLREKLTQIGAPGIETVYAIGFRLKQDA